MALSNRIVADAADPKSGMSITEFLEFARAVEDALTRGTIVRDDLLRGSIGMGAQIKRLSVDVKANDKGIFHTA